MGARFSNLRLRRKHLHGSATQPLDSRSQAVSSSSALFRLGIIADIQHADIDDGKSFHGASRYYRQSKEILQRAVDYWRGEKVAMAVSLGDIIDGFQV